MGRRHYRVTLADAIEAHEQLLDAFGGLRGISNYDAILGALGRPYHGYHRMIYRKAAALLHGIATAHGFNDGNKRTSWVVTELMIVNSGFSYVHQTGDRIDDLVVNVVTGDMTQEELVMWFKLRIKKA